MSVTRPRGPLPARVYWLRRLIVLGVAFGLVFGVSRLVAGTSEDAPAPAAQPASGAVTTTPSPRPVATADADPTTRPGPGAKPRRTSAPLAMPTGPCRDSDVRIVPSVERAYAGDDVRLPLRLVTVKSPACTWEVSPGTVAVRLASGADRIWSSQDCPGAVPTESVVLRPRPATVVEVVWSGRRSDSDCSRTTQWAQPGWYHLTAAALGSEPESQRFQLRSPAPITVTPTPTPKPAARADRQSRETPPDPDVPPERAR